MNFDQLQYIISLNDKKSLSAVAEEHYTSHQSVKNSIKYLEEELGLPLIVSTKQGTSLTKAGECLYRYGLKFSALYSEMRDEMNSFKDNDVIIRDSINLYVAPIFSTEMYQKFFEEFENKKELAIDMRIYPAEKIVNSVYALQKNSIGFFPMNNNNNSFEALRKNIKKRNMKVKVINELQSFAVVYKDSKYAKYDSIELKTLEKMSLYTFLNTNIFCGSKSIYTDIQYFNDFSVLKALLKKNHGVAVMKRKEYDFYFGAKNMNFRLIPIEDANIKIIAIYNNCDEYNKDIQDLVDEMSCFVG